MDLGLRDKRALVNGGSSGIGFAIAQALAEEGARVTIAGREEKKLAEAVSRLGAKGSRIDAVQLDLTDENSTRRGIEQALAQGPIDILVNNTGGPAAGPILDIPLSGWDKGYASLIRSVVVGCHLVVPGMRERRWGRILTVTSTSAREIIPRLPVSSTFRAGLTALTKELAKELGRSGILVNNLLPGPIRTARLQELAVKSPQFYQSMETHSALGRVGEPEELGRIAAFLCSAANTYLTGTDVLADGGYTAAL
jgi:3-oxoacyl-[acyl-carrier protein] reductase